MAYGIVNVPGAGAAELEGTVPASHASPENIYGAGDSANYGHVQLSDSTSSNSGAESGVAATPKAVKAAYDLAQNALAAAEKAQKTANEALDAAGEGSGKAEAVIVPSQSGTLTYNGSEQFPVWNGFNAAAMEISGTASAIDAGDHTAVFTLKEGYTWSGGGTEAKSVQWTIKRANVDLPAQSGTLTYTGKDLTPAWTGYDTAKLTIGGTTKGTNAGSYDATFTPESNYQWPDGTYAAKTVTWSIGKAAGSLSLDMPTMKLDVSTLTDTITVTRAGDGVITASSSDTNTATAEVSGTTVTVTAKAAGSADITVSVAAGTNHTAPASQKCSVTVALPDKVLDNNTPDIIQKAAKAGVAPNYWKVGDKIGIIDLKGIVGTQNPNPETYYAFIIGFNHNPSVEGDNSIHFQFGKTSDGTDIAVVQSYGDTSTGFCMNTTAAGKDGWSGSYMRNTICPMFLAALPADWQDIIVPCTKYSDNKGVSGSSSSAEDVTSTSDKIWLLAEFEVFGVRSGANPAEQNYQEQYDYYKNGNSTVKYKQNETSSPCSWWLRSVNAFSGTTFRRVDESGDSNHNTGHYSYGLSPGFMVA